MAALGSLEIKLGINAAELKTGLDSASSKVSDFARGMTDLGKDLTTKVGLPLAGIGGVALKMSGDFNAAMANVASLGDEAFGQVDEWKPQVQDLAIAMGKGTSDMAGGLYQVVSAFGVAGDSMAVLEINAMAAAGGLATTTEAINLTSAVTKAYGDTSATAVQQVADLALRTVQMGQTTFPELAASIGGVTPLASSLGVGMEELFGVMATATGVTGSAAEVSTQLRGVLQSLMAPTASMSELIGQLGFASGEAMLKELGLQGSINAIIQAAEASGMPLQKFIGSVEGQTLALALAGPQAATLAEKIRAMLDAAGTSQQAFDAQTQGINAAGFAWDQARTRLEVFMQRLGDGLAPALVKVLDLANPLINRAIALADAFARADPKIQSLVFAVGGLAAAAGPVLVVLGTLAGALGNLLPIAANLIGMIAGGGGLGAVIGALMGPVGAVIAVVVALAIAWQKNWFGIRDITAQVVDILKAAFVVVAGHLRDVVGAAIQWLTDLWQNSFAPTLQAVANFIKGPLLETLGAWARALIDVVGRAFSWLSQNVIGPFVGSLNRLVQWIGQISGRHFPELRIATADVGAGIAGITNILGRSINTAITWGQTFRNEIIATSQRMKELSAWSARLNALAAHSEEATAAVQGLAGQNFAVPSLDLSGFAMPEIGGAGGGPVEREQDPLQQMVQTLQAWRDAAAAIRELALSTIRTLPQGLLDQLRSQTELAIGTFKQMFDALGPGVLADAQNAASAASSVASAMATVARSYAEIASIATDLGGAFPATRLDSAFVNLKAIAQAMLMRIREIGQSFSLEFLAVAGFTTDAVKSAAEALATTARAFGEIVEIAQTFGGRFPTVDPARAFENLRDIAHGMVLRLIELTSIIDIDMLPAANQVADSIGKAAGALSSVAKGFAEIFTIASGEAFGGRFPEVGIAHGFERLRDIGVAMAQRLAEAANVLDLDLVDASNKAADAISKASSTLAGVASSIRTLFDFKTWTDSVQNFEANVLIGTGRVILGMKAGLLAIRSIFMFWSEEDFAAATLEPALQTMLDSWNKAVGSVAGAVSAVTGLVQFAGVDLKQLELKALVGAGRVLIAMRAAVLAIQSVFMSWTAEDFAAATLEPALQTMLDSWNKAVGSISSAINSIQALVGFSQWQPEVASFLDAVRDGAQKTIDGMIVAADAIRAAFTDWSQDETAQMVIGQGVQALLDGWNKAIGAISGAINSIQALVGFSQWQPEVASFLDAVRDGAQKTIDGMIVAADAIRAAFTDWSDDEVAQAAIGEGTQALLDGWNKAIGTISGAVDAIKSILAAGIATLDLEAFGATVHDRLIPALVAMAQELKAGIEEIGAEAIVELGEAARAIEPIAAAVQGVVEAISSVFDLGGLGKERVQVATGGLYNQGVWKEVDRFAEFLDEGIERLRTAIPAIAAALSGIEVREIDIAWFTEPVAAVTSILTALEQSWENLANAGVTGIAWGISAALPAVQAAFAALLSEVASSVAEINAALAQLSSATVAQVPAMPAVAMAAAPALSGNLVIEVRATGETAISQGNAQAVAQAIDQRWGQRLTVRRRLGIR